MGCSSSCNRKKEELTDTNALLLHGQLRVHIVQAKDLPDTDKAFFNISQGDLTDPYVELRISDRSLLKTSVIND